MANSNSTTSTPKKFSSGSTQKPSSAQNEKIAALEAQVKMLTELLMAQQGATQQVVVPSRMNEEVTVVHLVENADGLRTHIELSNMTIDFRKFGEERTLPLMVFEELVGKYRSFFERGVLAVGDSNVDIAKRYGLKVTTQYPLNRELIDRLGAMSMTELEELYNKLGDGHRKFILEQWRRKCLQKNPAFRDIRKLEVLNRLSDGAMDSVMLDIRMEGAKKSSDK